jgi:hypothetical protein
LQPVIKVQDHRNELFVLELKSRLFCERSQAGQRKAGPVGRIAEPFDLLRPGRSVRVEVSNVVGQHDSASGAHHPGQLLDQASGHRDVMNREARDGAVHAGCGQLQRGRVAHRERRVAQSGLCGLTARKLDHRGRQVDAVNFAHARREVAADDPWPARRLQPSLTRLRRGETHERIKRLGIPCHGTRVERLSLLRELSDDRPVLHQPRLRDQARSTSAPPARHEVPRN